jgi:Leucine-rich repeat (LRR) protein
MKSKQSVIVCLAVLVMVSFFLPNCNKGGAPSTDLNTVCDGFDVAGWWKSLDPTIQKALNETIGSEGTNLPQGDNLQRLFGQESLKLSAKGMKGAFTLPPCFKKLTVINCDRNQLTSLDVSKVPALEVLGCRINQLTSLNVSGLSRMIEFNCNNNQLTTLNIVGLTSLRIFWCENNNLTSLYVDPNDIYDIFSIYNNPLGYEGMLKVLTDLNRGNKGPKIGGWSCEANNISKSNGLNQNDAYEGSDCDKLTKLWKTKFSW